MLVKSISDSFSSISTEKLEEIIFAMRAAPTGDNGQHWQYRILGNSIEIIHEPKRAKHILNQDFYASLLSLGTIIESAKIWSDANSFSMDINYYLKDLNRPHFATLSFEYVNESEKNVLNLLEYLPLRETNRNHFKKDPLEIDQIKNLQSQLDSFNLKINFISRPSKKFLEYLIHCEKYIWNNRDVFLDTVRWIRFNQKEVEKHRDGFNLKNIKLKKIDGLFIRIFEKSNFLYRFFWRIGLNLKIHLEVKTTLKNTGSFYSFSSRDNSIEGIVNIGRASLRTWVYLNSIGHGVQPLTIASLLPFILEEKGSLANCSDRYLSIFLGAKTLLNKEFSLNQNERIKWMFRTGPAKKLSSDARTLRKDLSFYLKE